jgi:hypothetical protein
MAQRRKLNPRELKPYAKQVAVFGKFSGEREADTSLAESVKSFGIIEEITVLPDNTILCGHRRAAAAIKAGIEKIPAKVVELDEAESFRLWCESNNSRQMTHEERARWVECHMEVRRIAKKNGEPVPDTRPEEAVGWSRKTAGRARAAVKAIDQAEEEGNEEAAEYIRQSLAESPAKGERAAREVLNPDLPKPENPLTNEQQAKALLKAGNSKLGEARSALYAACLKMGDRGTMLKSSLDRHLDDVVRMIDQESKRL